MIVIHTTETSYNGAINWFTLPNKNASGHYFIRSSDGEITQMVRDADIAWHAGDWHAGDWATNVRSIGIEHEAFVNDSTWYTDTMYHASAVLVRHLAAKYNIPLNRQHIIGHVEVPGCPYSGGGASCHTDPGTFWDWDKFMQLLRADVPAPTPSPSPTPTATATPTASPLPAITGNLIGLVYNAETNARLSGATVSAGGQTVQSNSNGVYYFRALPAGETPVTVTLSGFAPLTQASRIEANSTRWNSVWLSPLAETQPPVTATATPTVTPSPSPTATPSPTVTPLPTATPSAPTGTLVGLIQDAQTGRRLAGVTVLAQGRTYVTDERGYYWLGTLPEGVQVVTAQKAGYITGRRSRVVIAGGVQWNSITLEPLPDR